MSTRQRTLIALVIAILWAFATSAHAAVPNVSGGKFEVTCAAKAIPDQAIDPLKNFGMSPSAHLHTFFGNKGLTDTSTADSIRGNGAGTTCKLPADQAAYWIPTACKGECQPVAGGDPERGPFTNAVPPVKVFAYYFGVTRAQGIEQPYPDGFNGFIFGNSAAQSPADVFPQTLGFSCGNGGSHHSPNRSAPYACTAANGVRGTDGVVAIVKAPYCLTPGGAFEYGASNGVGPCPTGDTTLAQLQLHVHYGHNNTGMQDGSLLHFSSGPYYTLHGDYLPGWDLGKFAALVTGCLAPDKDCGFLTINNPGPG